jgi:hypothetical protein
MLVFWNCIALLFIPLSAESSKPTPNVTIKYVRAFHGENGEGLVLCLQQSGLILDLAGHRVTKENLRNTQKDSAWVVQLFIRPESETSILTVLKAVHWLSMAADQNKPTRIYVNFEE